MQPRNDIAWGIGAGIISACLFLFSFWGFPFLSQFAFLPVFYAGLGNGTANAAIACGVGFIFICLTGHLVFALTFLFLFLLPSLYIISQALLNRTAANGTTEWYPSGLLTIQVTVVGLLIMGVVFTFLNIMLDEQKIKHMYDIAQGQHKLEFASLGLTLENILKVIRIFPGLSSFGLIFTMVMNGAAAQKILVHQHKNIRPAPDIKTLEMPLWPWLGLAIWGMTAVFFHSGLIGDFALNVVLVLMAAFMLQGISIFHVFFEGKPQNKIYLWGFYFLLLVFPWLVIVIGIMGVFEPWFNLRQKIKENFRS